MSDLIIGWTCDDCDKQIGDEPGMWDLAEKFRKEHEAETGHTTTVEVIEEQRILPSQADRMAVGEATIDIADSEIDWICPECGCSGEELGTTKRCPDCDERLREVLPDGGRLADNSPNVDQ
jgi:Zn finger protein HypA/HybF involved in hydrogenase expression